jgi:hypothetical protein
VTVCVLCCHHWPAGDLPLCGHDTLAFGFTRTRAEDLCAEIRDHQENGIPGVQRRLFDIPSSR